MIQDMLEVGESGMVGVITWSSLRRKSVRQDRKAGEGRLGVGEEREGVQEKAEGVRE